MSEDKRLSLQEAMEMLTVGEVQGIERHYGRSMESGNLSGTDLTAGVVWALERRKFTGKDKPDWSVFEGWTMKNLNDYFEPEEIEVEPADPETEQGKDASLAVK
jgi:hypothetical protein